MKARSQKGRGLFYTRDSGGKHEMTPGQYVGWAQRRTAELGVKFDGTPEAIMEMIRTGRHRQGDLFLDYGVSGNVLTRDGLTALMQESRSDLSVSHILIPRRDRLARPDDPVDAVQLENVLRHSGLTLVFMDRVCKPFKKGQRHDIGELIVSLIDYEKSGKDRRELAEKMIFAQLQLARSGFSVGGRASYGFRRWLAKADGTAVRQLADGEYVRMAGHHVVWLPGPEEELAIIRRILGMLETMPANRVAATLTKERVPTPDHGRTRTDGGVEHPTGGTWQQSVIQGIARNTLLSAVATYGRRSMGDQVRFTPTGPRGLEAEDYRADGKPKVVRNSEETFIRQASPVHFDPIIDPERQRALVARLDERAGTQRGKPRSRQSDKNPLGCRVFDLNCTWPMYRQPYNDSFRYLCGFYQQSHGQECAHNHVGGPEAVRFLLECLRQKVLNPRVLEKLERRLLQLAQGDREPNTAEQERRDATAKLDEVGRSLERVNRNLALAESAEQFRAISQTQKDLQQQHDAMVARVALLERSSPARGDQRAEADEALGLLHRLADLAADDGNYAAVGDLFRQVNVRLYLRFEEVQVKKRKLNKVAGGVVTFGSTPPPVALYEGPTGRRKQKDPAAGMATGPGDHTVPAQPGNPGREGNSLGNDSRGERIRTSDLLNPIQEHQQPNPFAERGVTESVPSGCTAGCTSVARADETDLVAAIAAALLGMSPADRARLAALLVAGTEGRTT